MLITYAAGGIFLVENPANSLIALHPRWIWMLEQLRKHGVTVPQPWFDRFRFFFHLNSENKSYHSLNSTPYIVKV